MLKTFLPRPINIAFAYITTIQISTMYPGAEFRQPASALTIAASIYCLSVYLPGTDFFHYIFSLLIFCYL